MPETRVAIPNHWTPRDYQRPLWDALCAGKDRALAIWHRRSGKDDVSLHWTARSAMTRPGTYWYMLPKQEQARKAIWDATVRHPDGSGKTIRRVDWAFPEAIRSRDRGATRDDMMRIRFVNDATWQVVGSDSYNNLVGSNPIGVVFSEWPLSDPQAWAFIRPILRENGGWAIFNGTPRGQNHAHRMFLDYQSDDEWFVQRLTAIETGVFTPNDLDKERQEFRTDYGLEAGDALFRQEYECSFEAPVLGAYYARELNEIDGAGGITKVPYDPSGGPVHVSFDLGVGDQTALWFVQQVGREVHVLDYYAAMGVGMEHYLAEIQRRYRMDQLGDLILPHDAKHREKLSGHSVQDFFTDRRFNVMVVPAPTNGDALMQEINAVRRFLPRCVFDRERTGEGLDALRSYRAEYDALKRAIAGRPVHDWASHGADSFRTLVMGWEKAARPVGTAAPRVRRRLGVQV